MKKLILILQLILVPFLASAQKQKVDSILSLHFKAVGGIDTWQRIKSFYVEQSYFSNPPFSPAYDPSIYYPLIEKMKRTYFKYPDQYKVELYRDGDLRGTFITNAKEVKGINQTTGREEIFPDSAREMLINSNQIYSIGSTPRFLSAVEENSVTYEGITEAFGKQCHKFLMAKEDLTGKYILYLDVKTHFIYATSDLKQKLYKIYSQYQEVGEGIKIPYRLVSYENGEIYEDYKIIDAAFEFHQKPDDLIIEDR